MQTIFDWVTLGVFVGLIVLLLERSSKPNPPDRLWQYAPAAVGCAISNYLGNEGYRIAAIIGIVAILAYIYYVLKPFQRG